MGEMVYERARKDAQRIDAEYGDGYLPTDVESLARLLGIEVIFTHGLPDTISGMIVKTEDDDRATVMIDAHETQERQRFTLAHEIGHYAERRLARGDDDFSFRDDRQMGSSNLHEFYANEFAGDLLMPASDVRACQDRDMTRRQMARRYGVTLAAMNRRLERLREHPDEEMPA